MAKLKVYDSGVITAAAASESQTVSGIKGYIVKIEIVNSASTDYRMYVDASANGSKAIVDEYVVGSSVTALTVASTSILYPRIPANVAAGTAVTDSAEKYLVSGDLNVDVSALTASDTYQYVIYYEELEN